MYGFESLVVESEGTTKARAFPATALVGPALGGGSRGIMRGGEGSPAVASNAAWIRSLGVGLLACPGDAAAGVAAAGVAGAGAASAATCAVAGAGSWGSITALGGANFMLFRLS